MALRTLMMTAAATALIAGGAAAQDTSTAGDTTTDMSVASSGMAASFTSIEDMTVADLVGQSVYEPDGDTIGDVEYVIGTGSTAEVVIGIGGFLGLGEYTVGLPLGDFTYDADQKMVKVDRTREDLKEQPEIDELQIEGLPDDTLLADFLTNDDASGDADGSDGMAEDGSGADEGAAMETEGAADDGDAATEEDTDGTSD